MSAVAPLRELFPGSNDLLGPLSPTFVWFNDRMGVLAELGLNTADGGVMLVDPPDSVMAEAGTMKPRPSTASSLMTAEPTHRIAWWPLADQLTPALMGRLGWMVSVARGEAWLVLDPGDPTSPTTKDVRAAIRPGGLHPAEERTLSTGELALRLA